MALPATVIEGRDQPKTTTAPTDIGVGFAVVLADRGPIVPTKCRNLAEVVKHFGPKLSTSGLYDGADVFFREKGYALFLQRAVGPGATYSTLNLAGGAGTSLIATDKVGQGASNVTLDVLTHTSDPVTVPVVGHYRVRVRYAGDIVEDSGDLATRGDAVAWSANSDYVGLALGADPSVPVAVAAAGLAGGNADIASVTTTQLQSAFDAIPADLGPGQVAAPGYTSDAVHQIVVGHAFENDRTYVLDLPDSPDDSVLRASSSVIRALGRALGSAKGGMFGPFDIAPGEAVGTTRVVPPSWRQMATMARNDAAGMSPNEPAAGDNGRALYVTGVTQTYDDVQRQALNEAGCNITIMKYGVPVTYGFRTPVDQVVDRNYSRLSNQRLEMAIRAEFKQVEDRFQFKELDGFGRNISRFVSAIDGVLLSWFTRGSLKGATASEAYRVDGGPNVNTDETEAAGELRAETVVRMSPFNERTIIGIAKVPSEEEL